MGEVFANPGAVSVSEKESSLAGTVTEGADSDLVSELTDYLGNLGLGDTHLARVFSLMNATHGDADSPDLMEEDTPAPAPQQWSPAPTGQSKKPDPSEDKKTVGLYLVEEQQILMQAYQSFFTSQSSIELLGSSADTSAEVLVEAASSIQPDVILLGVKALRPSTVEILETLREACPTLPMVLLFAFYDAQGIKALREFSRDVSVGRAYLLKHTIDTVDQLTHAISSVAEGRMIVDPTIMEELIKTGDSQNGMLRELSPRALEVLHWVARGYRNDTIADVLSRDVKTIERHINNIYTTLLGPDDNAKHPRVRAALMYLRATGVLSTEQVMEE